MPFVSEKQRRACYAQAAEARKKGKRPTWNCESFGRHSVSRSPSSKIRYRVIIRRSSNPQKKFDAIVRSRVGEKIVRFGARGYDDFTTHRDNARRRRYIQRHRKNEIWSLREGVFTSGFWSRWLLWEEPSLNEAIKSLTRKFKSLHVSRHRRKSPVGRRRKSPAGRRRRKSPAGRRRRKSPTGRRRRKSSSLSLSSIVDRRS